MPILERDMAAFIPAMPAPITRTAGCVLVTMGSRALA